MKKLLVILLSCGLIFTAGCGSRKTENGSSVNKAADEKNVEKADEQTDFTEEETAADAETTGNEAVTDDIPETNDDAASLQNLSDEAKESLELLRQTLKENNAVIGCAFLGYSGEYSGIDTDELFAAAKDIYYFDTYMSELEKYPLIEFPGEEVYLIVPADEKWNCDVYEQVWNDASKDGMPGRGDLVYKGNPGEVFIVKGNQSDIISNIEIEVKTNGGEFIFSPCLSLENGRLQKTKSVYDLTAYNDDGYDAEYSNMLDDCFSVLEQNPSVQKCMADGMSLMYGDDEIYLQGEYCPVFYLGTDHPDNFVTEKMLAVTSDDVIYAYDVLTDSWNEF